MDKVKFTHTRKIHAGGVQNTAILSERRMLSREDSILFIESGKKRVSSLHLERKEVSACSIHRDDS